jgi:hypothetical protein
VTADYRAAASDAWLFGIFRADPDAPMTLFILREPLSFPRLVFESQTCGIL